MGRPDLYVLRHGETAWNAEGRMQGHADSPLTERGRAQAAAQGRILREIGAAGLRVVASPSGRALETAAIATGRDAAGIETDARLMEIDVGGWTGLVRGQGGLPPLDPRRPEDIAVYDAAPGGEGLGGLAARCAAFLAGLDGPAILVTHGITSRMLRSIALHGDGRGAAGVPGGQGCVHAVRAGAHQTFE